MQCRRGRREASQSPLPCQPSAAAIPKDKCPTRVGHYAQLKARNAEVDALKQDLTKYYGAYKEALAEYEARSQLAPPALCE